MGMLIILSIPIISIVVLQSAVVDAVCTNFSDVKGIFAAVLTPAYDDGTVRVDVINQYAQFLKDSSIDGVVVAVTAGEGPNLDVSEHKLLLDAWMAAAPPLGLYVFSAVGATPLPDALEVAAYSEELGVDAILVMTEVYFKPENADDLVNYVRYYYEAAPNTPLLYDHAPHYSNVDVDMEEFFDLATEEIPTFKGVNSDVFKTSLLLQNKVQDDQRIFVSDTEGILAAQALSGFDSYILGGANTFPNEIREIVTAGLNGDLELARELNQRLNDLRNIFVELGQVNSNTFAILKEAMLLINGIDVGPIKPPIIPLTDEDKSTLAAELRAQNVTLYGDY